MKQLLTDENGYKNFIINSLDIDVDIKEIYILYSIIDALINKVKPDSYQKYSNNFKEYLTLKELAEIYKLNNWSQNNGLLGVCFERFIYNMLVSKAEPDLDNFILGCLGRLDPFHKDDNFDVILWGTEKGEWLTNEEINLSLSVINENDCINMNKQSHSFKDILKKFYHNNKQYLGYEKADLFVKFKRSNIWFGVDVKLNIEAFKGKNPTILPIRIALKTDNIKRWSNHCIKQDFPELNANTFIFYKTENYIEILTHYYRCMHELLDFFSKNSTNNFPGNSLLHSLNKYIFYFLHENKDSSIYIILEYFANIITSKGIQLPKRIFIPNTCNTFLLNNYDYSLINSQSSENKIKIG